MREFESEREIKAERKCVCVCERERERGEREEERMEFAISTPVVFLYSRSWCVVKVTLSLWSLVPCELSASTQNAY